MRYYDAAGRLYTTNFIWGGPAIYWQDGRPLGVGEEGGFTVPLHEGPDPVAVELVFDGSEKFPIIDEFGGYVSAVTENMQYAGGSFGQIIGGQPYVDGVARTLAYMSTTPAGGSVYVLDGGVSIDARTAAQHASDITGRDLSTHQTLLDRVANVATAVVLIAAGGLVAGDMAAAAGVGAEGAAAGASSAAPEAAELGAEVLAPSGVASGAAPVLPAAGVGGAAAAAQGVLGQIVSGVGSAAAAAVVAAVTPKRDAAPLIGPDAMRQAQPAPALSPLVVAAGAALLLLKFAL
jgi:hypothetical protein